MHLLQGDLNDFTEDDAPIHRHHKLIINHQIRERRKGHISEHEHILRKQNMVIRHEIRKIRVEMEMENVK